MKREDLETFITRLPIYQYIFVKPSQIPISERIRSVCSQECDRYQTTWACPPAVGSIEECKARCMEYEECFFFSTVAEVADIANFDALLKTRKEHEEITEQILSFLKKQDVECYALSTESCEICEECTYPEAPCRYLNRMHPCVESHGIVVTELAEKSGMDYMLGMNQILWFGIIFFQKTYIRK